MTSGTAPFDLSVDRPSERVGAMRDAVCWLVLAVGALAVSGLFSLVLVVGRVPGVASVLIHDAEFARRSLVVHVNLAMGVWFFAVLAGLFRLLPSPPSPPGIPGTPAARRGRVVPVAVLLATLGVVGFTIPMFFKNATPILSNYVPAIDHRLFLAGLAVFAAGIMLNFMDARLLPTAPADADSPANIPADAQHGIRAAALAFLIAMLTIGGAWFTQNADMTPAAYYERLFWGGGHVLQAANTLGMLAAWLILLHRLTGRITVSPKVAAVLFGLMLLPILPGPWLTFGGYASHWFTRMMEFGLFPVTLVLLGCGATSLWRHRRHLGLASLATPAFVGLVTSAVMTLVGFVLGAMIAADTTLIPAHYHANIGAVTVAYMAAMLTLLPRLGAAVPWPRLAGWQPLLYGVGQMVFVLGLAVAGGLGQAARKTYGHEQHLHATAEGVGLIIAGMGGVVALGGGLLFVAIMTCAALKARRGATNAT